jgi:hypothetical protein
MIIAVETESPSRGDEIINSPVAVGSTTGALDDPPQPDRLITTDKVAVAA